MIPRPPPSPRLPLALLLLATLAVFGPGLGADFVWDDNPLIRNNDRLRDPSSLGAILTGDFWDVSDLSARQESGYYRPVVSGAFFAIRQAFGPGPFAFHAVNLALHLGAVALAFYWVRRRVRRGHPSLDPTSLGLVAALATLPFALHPSRPESVTWVAGSTELWMAFWVLSGLTLWDRRRGWPGTLGASVCFVLALLSKETAVVVPLLLALDGWLWPTDAGKRRRHLELLAVAAIVWGAAFVRNLFHPVRYVPIFGDGVGALCGRVAASVGMFALRLLWPFDPSVQGGAVDTDAAGRALLPGWAMAAGATVLALAVLFAIVVVRRPSLRPALADLCFVALPLAPVLNLVPMRYVFLVGDRLLYLPMLGVGALLARLAASVLVRAPSRRPAVLLAGAGMAIVFALESSAHVGHFQSDLELWGHEFQRAPDQRYGAEMYARALWAAGEPRAALEPAQAALLHACTPDERLRSALLWLYLRRSVVGQSGPPAERRQVRDALDRFADPSTRTLLLPVGGKPVAIEIDPRARERTVAATAFSVEHATALAQTGDVPAAERIFRELVTRAPNDPAHWANLARLLAWERRWSEAAALLAQARARFPDDRGIPALAAAVAEGERAARDRSASGALAEAGALVGLGATDAARDALGALSPSDRQRPEARLVDARIALGEGRLDDATRAWQTLAAERVAGADALGEEVAAARARSSN